MITKEYSKTGRSCKVTFVLPPHVASTTASVCGDFNDWAQDSHPLKRRKDGNFSTTVTIKPGTQYRFRYLIDGERWENDEQADAYLPNSFGSDDSVVQV